MNRDRYKQLVAVIIVAGLIGFIVGYVYDASLKPACTDAVFKRNGVTVVRVNGDEYYRIPDRTPIRWHNSKGEPVSATGILWTINSRDLDRINAAAEVLKRVNTPQ